LARNAAMNDIPRASSLVFRGGCSIIIHHLDPMILDEVSVMNWIDHA